MIRTPRLRLLCAVLVSVASAAVATPLHAQRAADKRPLQIADYRLWRSISDESISDDGRWVAWTYTRVRGDDTLVVRSVDDETRHEVARASQGVFSSDGRWIGYSIAPEHLEVERLEREGDPVPRQAGLLDLSTGATHGWDDVDSFGFAEGGSHFWVKKRKADEDAEHDGTDLILRNLREGYEELIGSVGELAFDEEGTRLAFTVDAEGGDGNGVYVLDLATGARRGLDNSKERYARLTGRRTGARSRCCAAPCRMARRSAPIACSPSEALRMARPRASSCRRTTRGCGTAG